jgi:cytochrome c551/c552
MKQLSTRRIFVLISALTMVGCGGGMAKIESGKTVDSGTQVLDAGLPDAGGRSALAIAGEALAKAKSCGACHSSAKGLLAGSTVGIANKPVFGSNLTPDMATGIGGWTDADIIRAIRFGIDDEGKTLCSEMPRDAALSDADGEKLVAYLKSIPAVNNANTPSTCTPTAGDKALHGKIVSETSGCNGCHKANYAGDDVALPGTQSYAHNITPDMTTGIGSWTQAQIVVALKTGIDDEGALLCETMPRYANLNDDELASLAVFLQSVAAVSHAAPKTVCTPTDAGMTLDAGFDSGVALIDSGIPDAGRIDAGIPRIDSGVLDAGRIDSGVPVVDSGVPDAGRIDSGVAMIDSGVPDAGRIDSGIPIIDSGIPDAGRIDSGVAIIDSGIPDSGTPVCNTTKVVLSQVYGGGGNTGATFKSDFVELHNRTNVPQSIAGWAIQYASSAGTSWGVAVIPVGTTIAPGEHMLFALTPPGTFGASIDSGVLLVSPINISTTAGKVALTNTAAALTGTCPTSAALVDFLGFGGSNCAEGSMPSAVLSSSTAAQRKDAVGASLGCVDTDVNANDFAELTPVIHSTSNACSCP